MPLMGQDIGVVVSYGRSKRVNTNRKKYKHKCKSHNTKYQSGNSSALRLSIGQDPNAAHLCWGITSIAAFVFVLWDLHSCSSFSICVVTFAFVLQFFYLCWPFWATVVSTVALQQKGPRVNKMSLSAWSSVHVLSMSTWTLRFYPTI